MLRTLMIATALLTASGTALAHGDSGYGRVVSVEPHFVISFGTPYPDGFRVLYETGGARYWTTTPYRPGPTILLPPRYRVQNVYHHREYRRDDWRDDRRHDWRDDHRDNRRDRRDGRRDGRYD
jgi:hypothetical protein